MASSPPNEHEYVATWNSVCGEKTTGQESLKEGLTTVSAWATETASDGEMADFSSQSRESSSSDEPPLSSSSRLGGSVSTLGVFNAVVLFHLCLSRFS